MNIKNNPVPRVQPFWTALLLLIALFVSAHPTEPRHMRLLETDPLQTVNDAISLDSLQLYVKQLSGYVPVTLTGGKRAVIGTRHKNYADNDTAAIWLKQKLESYGLTTVRQSFSASGFNVYAEQPGWRFPRQKYMICAHYDDQPLSLLAPGADDNASGSAAVIEAARILTDSAYPYTIVYAFWDEEEQGLIGSKYYAQIAKAAGDSILGVINLDMIAFDSNNNSLATLHVRPFANSLFLGERMVEVNTNYNIGLVLNTINPGLTSSDQSSFWNQGYSAVLLIEDYYNDFSWYYHSIRDSISKFNMPYFERCSRLGLLTLTSFAAKSAPDTPLLTRPAHLLTEAPIRSRFQWQEMPSATSYRLQASTNSAFTQMVIDSSGLPQPQWVSKKLPRNTTIYWRSRSCNKTGSSPWSSTFSLTTTGIKQQSIILEPGWNLTGCALFPNDSTLTNMMTGIRDHLTLIKDEAGQVYWPAQGIDNLGNWRAGRGYWIRVTTKDTLQVAGDPIHSVPMPIALHVGWNMPAFLAQNPLPPAQAFATILGNFILVKTGNGLVYWPAYGINQISALEPGQGLQVYMNRADTLLYPVESLSKESTIAAPVVVHFPVVGQTGNNMIVLLRGLSLADGDEIAIRTVDQRIVGAAVVSSGQALLTVWGDDAMTPSIIEGAQEGESLAAVYWSASQNQEWPLQITSLEDALQGQQPVHTFVYHAQAALITDVAKPVSVPEMFALQQNYPNPFNATTQIRYGLAQPAHVQLQVFNALGQLLTVLVDAEQPAGEHRRTWSAENLPSGVYLYRIRTEQFTVTKKMILVR